MKLDQVKNKNQWALNHTVSQEGIYGDMEFILLDLDEQLFLLHGHEYGLHMVDVLLMGLRKDQDIVQIHKNKSIEHVPQNILKA